MTLGDSLGPAHRPALYGIRGWLAFLCVSLLLFTPIGLAADVIDALRAPATPYVKALFIGLDILLGGLAVCAGIALVRFRPIGLRVAKILFICTAAVWVFIGALALVLAEATAEAVVQSIGHIVVSAAWLTYLYKSERVRNTYSRVQIDQAADVFR